MDPHDVNSIRKLSSIYLMLPSVFVYLARRDEQQSVFKPQCSTVGVDPVPLILGYRLTSLLQLRIGKVRERAPKSAFHHGLPTV